MFTFISLFIFMSIFIFIEREAGPWTGAATGDKTNPRFRGSVRWEQVCGLGVEGG